jgi:hypothetical protein
MVLKRTSGGSLIILKPAFKQPVFLSAPRTVGQAGNADPREISARLALPRKSLPTSVFWARVWPKNSLSSNSLGMERN